MTNEQSKKQKKQGGGAPASGVNKSKTPQIIPPDAHSISLDSVNESAVQVAAKLASAGFEAYLVGGCVRDLLLGTQPKDFDLATDARPEEIKQVFRSCRLIGRRFRLAHVRFGREIIEVATFRAGLDDDMESEADEDDRRVSAAGQVMRDNVYGSKEDDVVRRDFRINALYYDPVNQTVIDYVNGMDDLRNGVLRTIGDPMERFREDPVRMLRAVRFSAKLGFKIDAKAQAATGELASLLHHVPPARMYDEVLKLFHGGHALETFNHLREHGLFRYLFPFTEQCLDGLVPNLPSLALRNTDRRIKEGKPVIPAFLFASMLWDPVRTDAEKLIDHGQTAARAWETATSDAIRDQAQHVAIPRRLAIVIKDIWGLQSKLEQRPPRMIARLMQHERFRAAYDFLMLRAEVEEVERKLAEWWTEIQEADAERQQRMISTLAPRSQKNRRRRRRKNPAEKNHANRMSKIPV